jgi:hypothetical protein
MWRIESCSKIALLLFLQSKGSFLVRQWVDSPVAFGFPEGIAFGEREEKSPSERVSPLFFIKNGRFV